MKHLASLPLSVLACAVSAAPGCFYVAPINQRPSISIHQLTDGTIQRGQMVQLEAITSDPDGDPVSLTWSAYACTSAVDPQPDCDAQPFTSSQLLAWALQVPTVRADGTSPVLAVRVILDAVDDRGAVARPEQELVIAVGDALPQLALRSTSAHDFVVGSHVALFADVYDPDDRATSVVLDWHTFTPAAGATFDLVDAPAPTAQPFHRGEAKLFVPHVTGAWDIRVTATDPVQHSAMADFNLVIGDDEPPCLVGATPIAQPGAALPLFEATAFAVPVVVDDLDTYPPVLGDIDAGAATFAWTLQTNGGAREPLPITGNRVTLDPASYRPGDVLELRVEASDRQDRSASFAACGDAATCTFNPVDATCAQRQTWRVEVQ